MIRDIPGGWSGLLMFFSALMLVGSFACTRPEIIGADLLTDEASQVGFSDTLSLHCRITTEDAVRTYITGSGRQIVRSLVGHLDDPIFGKTEAQLNSQLFLLTGSGAFLARTIDSVVVSLRYDTLGIYGDVTQPVVLSLYLLEESFDLQQDYRSDYAPAVSAQPIAVTEVLPRPRDSLYIRSVGDSIRVPPMVRLSMGNQFIQTLLEQDTSTYLVADSFSNFLKGIHIRMTPSAPNTMLAFDLRSFWSRMTVYYNNGVDTFSNEIAFALTDQLGFGVHHTYFAHDYSGSVVQEYLDDPARADTLLFVQGMSGVNVEVSLPSLPTIDNIVLNKAELEFFAPALPGDNLNFYPRVLQLITAVKGSSDYIEASEDVTRVLQQFQRLDFFGGNLMDSDTSALAPKKYVMNVTTSLQDIYKGRIDNQLFITPFLKPNVPHRVVLYGPNHPQYPARLRLYYTVVN